MNGLVVITQAEVKYFHSANGGGAWTLAPIQLPRGPLCNKINADYRKYVMEDLHTVSDLPFTENALESLCDKFEKVYYLSIYSIKTTFHIFYRRGWNFIHRETTS